MILREQQLQHEIDTDASAAADRLEQLRKDAAEGGLDLPRAQKFIARAYSQVKQSLEDTLAVQTRGVGGKYKGWLRKVPVDVAAVLALRECISQLTAKRLTSKPITIQILGTAIGRLYEMEVRIREAESVNPMYMQKIHEQVKENCTTSQSHLRKLYGTAYDRVMKEGAESMLSVAETLNLGKFGVQAVLDAGIIVLNKSTGSKGSLFWYSLTPEVSEFLCDYTDNDVQGVLNKATGAMMCAPDPWTNLRDGGYLSPRRKFSQSLMSMSNVRKSERKRLREVFTAENMPVVFEAANYLQSTPFSVHTPTIAAITRLWEGGGGTMGVPTEKGPVRPVLPLPPEWAKVDGTPEELAVFAEWKRLCVEYYSDLRTWRGKVREIGGFMQVTRSAAKTIWFPVHMDKRGRWYYRGTPNPQGSDLSKASLHSAIRKPLGERGVYWLKVHIANCFGFDKERFDARAAWVDQNWGSIKNALDEPENHADVWGTGAPWGMYSAAYELNQAYLSGNPETYECGVIIHMDATCSGLQHFSAMLRDTVGGGYTNLYDDNFVGPKQDIYSRVATNALAVIKLDSEDSDEGKAKVALWWLKAGIPRNMAKTPVMTYCYGATLRGTVDFVHRFVVSEMGLSFPPDVRPYDYAVYAAKKLFTGIAITVPAAEAAMQWLKSVAGQMPNGQRMEWTSPTGFRVQHDYQDYDEVRVRLRSCGVETALVREFNEDTVAVSMRNALAPNFVHALDASHLTFTAVAMKSHGLQMVGIHDSFGTHGCDVDVMHKCIRESFVHLYQSRNVLSEFLWDVNGVGEVPMRGNLDLTRVLQSEFFFC